MGKGNGQARHSVERDQNFASSSPPYGIRIPALLPSLPFFFLPILPRFSGSLKSLPSSLPRADQSNHIRRLHTPNHESHHDNPIDHPKTSTQGRYSYFVISRTRTYEQYWKTRRYTKQIIVYRKFPVLLSNFWLVVVFTNSGLVFSHSITTTARIQMYQLCTLDWFSIIAFSTDARSPFPPFCRRS